MSIRPNVLRSLIGILGDMCALALFVSHIPTSYCEKLVKRKRKATDESDENSWSCTSSHLVSLFRFALWILYGLPFITNGSYLFVISMATGGFLMELTYIIVYLVYADKKQRFYVYIVLMGEIIAYAGFVIGLPVGGLPQAFIAVWKKIIPLFSGRQWVLPATCIYLFSGRIE
ncbi:bidirectional sugar transporter SWEET5-like [Papaver somniferum]|uniref:bidirectional sugar transporter SWEET5-like n=1 Tax=Papaver somniferum TaxID=3469 RepID=UPI000E6FC561|nr:bidirectional sugar transporter SWEET5-like [Papaver somniferum]